MCHAVIDTISGCRPSYAYEIIIIDNCSTDGTRDVIRRLCRKNTCIKAIFNTRNFGQFNSPYYALLQTQGDCTILMASDFQDPPELIPSMIESWEEGYKIVCPVKTQAEEKRIIYFLRSCYYKCIKRFSSVDYIEHFTGFGLYDASFIAALRELDDPMPFLRGIVAELGFKRKEIPFKQPTRKSGKSKNNWYTLYDAAMLSFTSYTKFGMRLAVFTGAILSVLSLLAALVYFILKMMHWDAYPGGTIPTLLAVLVFGSVQMFFIGLLGEYILGMNTRSMKRPLVVEDERINFSQ